jgi:hypothetical protein
MKNLKIKTNVTFSESKSENKFDNLKIDFKIPDQSTVNKLVNLTNENLIIDKPIKKLPTFSKTIIKESVSKGLSTNLPKVINLPDIKLINPFKVSETDNTINDLNENYDVNIPRSEIISFIDYFPLQQNSNITEAGNHFRYQLLYLNANKLIIKKDLERYFSQSQKDLSNLDELKSFLSLIDDKKYSNINFDLYTKQYFEKILEIIEYCNNQILKFYSKFNSINDFFINESDVTKLLNDSDIEFQNTKIRQYQNLRKNAILIFLLNDKLSTYSKKLLRTQNSTSNIFFDDSFIIKDNVDKYKNLKINEGLFPLEIPYKQKELSVRIDSILDFIIYESYKNKNDYFDISNQNHLEITNINYDENLFLSGNLTTLLTKYDDNKFLISNNENETYFSKVFNDIISNNFSEDSIQLLGSEIQNIERNSNQILGNKISRFTDAASANKLINSLNQIETSNNPNINTLIRKIVRNLKNYNFNTYQKNLDTVIKSTDDLINFFDAQVVFCETQKSLGKRTIGTDRRGGSNNNASVKNLADALRFIHIEYEGKNWTEQSNVSRHYIPYGNSEENIQNFIGFLTYLFKRTSKFPGQYSRSYNVDQFVAESSRWSNIKYINSNAQNEEQGYWLAFNELLWSINNPDDEFSSLKNPFYKRFSDSYVNILSGIGIKNITYQSYDRNANITFSEEQMFIMFNTFVFLTDLIKRLYSFNCEVRWHVWYADVEFTNDYMLSAKNSIGVAGLTGNNDVIWYPNLNTKNLPKNEFHRKREQLDEGFYFFNNAQHFDSLDLIFDIPNIKNEFNTIKTAWKSKFKSIKSIYDYYYNGLNNANESIKELLGFDYDLLRLVIDQNFTLNKKNFFITRLKFNQIKDRFEKIKNSNNFSYVIEDVYNEKYYSSILKSLNDYYPNVGSNSKIMTFGVPNNVDVKDDIVVTIYRKNLVYENLKFKEIKKTFNVNLFCNLINSYEKLSDPTVRNNFYQYSDFYKFNNDLTFQKLSNINQIDQEILKNHFMSEILNEYVKIMTGLLINESTLIKNYPVINSLPVIENISNIIGISDENNKLKSISNSISTLINPLEFRSFLYSSSTFNRVYSTLIDPDDFEIDTSNWVLNNWNENNTPFKTVKYGDKLYLDDKENVIDSYKIKIDKK